MHYMPGLFAMAAAQFKAATPEHTRIRMIAKMVGNNRPVEP